MPACKAPSERRLYFTSERSSSRLNSMPRKRRKLAAKSSLGGSAGTGREEESEPYVEWNPYIRRGEVMRDTSFGVSDAGDIHLGERMTPLRMGEIRDLVSLQLVSALFLLLLALL